MRYTNEPLGDLKVIPEFLPYPEDLVLRDEGIKITISLSKRSIEFFKSEAKKYNTQYQRRKGPAWMIVWSGSPA